MPSARVHHVAVFEGSAFSLLARVVDLNNNPLVPAVVTSITCRIFDLNAGELIDETTLVADEVIYGSLQSDDRWTADRIGYNVSMNQGGLSPGGHTFRIEVQFIHVDGYDIFAVWDIRCRNVFSE